MDPVEGAPTLPSDRTGRNEALNALVVALVTVFARIAHRLNAVLPKDGSEAITGDLTTEGDVVVGGPLTLGTYTTAARPAAASYPGAVIYVSDGAVGQRFQGSHGGAWVFLG